MLWASDRPFSCWFAIMSYGWAIAKGLMPSSIVIKLLTLKWMSTCTRLLLNELHFCTCATYKSAKTVRVFIEALTRGFPPSKGRGPRLPPLDGARGPRGVAGVRLVNRGVFDTQPGLCR